MSLLDWFRRKEEAPSPGVIEPVRPVLVEDSAPRVVDISTQTHLTPPRMDAELRRGMWVAWVGPLGEPSNEDKAVRVGVVTGPSVNPGEVLVDETKPNGSTRVSGLRLHVSRLRQATYEQIPGPRKPQKSDADFEKRRAVFHRLGYK